MQHTEEVIKAARDFVGAFELVFDNDWPNPTRHILENDTDGDFISRTGTFIRPDVEDEGAAWANRAELLSSYRELKALLGEAS